MSLHTEPIPSNGTGIFTYIYHRFQANVGKYSIHGAFGYHTGLCILSHPWIGKDSSPIRSIWACRGMWSACPASKWIRMWSASRGTGREPFFVESMTRPKLDVFVYTGPNWPQNKAFSKQNKGHLGSRYIHTKWRMFYKNCVCVCFFGSLLFVYVKCCDLLRKHVINIQIMDPGNVLSDLFEIWPTKPCKMCSKVLVNATFLAIFVGLFRPKIAGRIHFKGPLDLHSGEERSCKACFPLPPDFCGENWRKGWTLYQFPDRWPKNSAKKKPRLPSFLRGPFVSCKGQLHTGSWFLIRPWVGRFFNSKGTGGICRA